MFKKCLIIALLFVLVNFQETVWAAVMDSESQFFKDHKDKMQSTLRCVELQQFLKYLEHRYLEKVAIHSTKAGISGMLAVSFVVSSRKNLLEAFWMCPGDPQRAVLEAAREHLKSAQQYFGYLKTHLTELKENIDNVNHCISEREDMKVKKTPISFNVAVDESYASLSFLSGLVSQRIAHQQDFLALLGHNNANEETGQGEHNKW